MTDFSRAQPLQPGDQVGKYAVVRTLGQGGMGIVFEVRHGQLGTRAALKLLWTGQRITKELAGRFITEARAGGVIEHPGVVHVHEYDQLPDGTPYILMEYLAGETLSARLRRVGRMGLAGLPILHQIAETLSVVHARHIVHRDLKPGNIMLVPDSVATGGERVKILDFGIAKILTSAEGDGGLVPEVRTADGALLGTPSFMAPELWKDQAAVDDKTDVYALGVIAYQVLAGRAAFQLDDPIALMYHHVAEMPTPMEQIDAGIPESLSLLVADMLRKEQSARPTMKQVAERLEAFIATAGSHPPPGAPPIVVSDNGTMSQAMAAQAAAVSGPDVVTQSGQPPPQQGVDAPTLSDSGAKTAPSLAAIPAVAPSQAEADSAHASRGLGAVALPEDVTLRPRQQADRASSSAQEEPTQRRESATAWLRRWPIALGLCALLLVLLLALLRC